MKVIFVRRQRHPPAWLTEKYPEVLNAQMDGVLLRHGARRHYNYNSPVYQELSARITGKVHLTMQSATASSAGSWTMRSTAKWMSFIRRAILSHSAGS